MLASSWLDLAGGAYMKARYRARQVPRGYFVGFCRASRPQTLLTETSGTRGSVALLLAPFVRGSFPDIPRRRERTKKSPARGRTLAGRCVSQCKARAALALNRRTPAKRRFLHDDKAGPLEMAHDAPRPSWPCIRQRRVFACAPRISGRRRWSRRGHVPQLEQKTNKRKSDSGPRFENDCCRQDIPGHARLLFLARIFAGEDRRSPMG